MISSFVASYGYFAVFFGTLLEGETVLIAAGFAAHRGLLDWQTVAGVAMLGATLGDQLAFLLGRWKGEALMARWPALARQKDCVLGKLERHHIGLILSVRFLYGLRIAGPVILGASRIPLIRFALLNLVGAALWASVITAAGYFLGATLEVVFEDLKRIEDWLIVLILVAGGGIWLWRRHHAPARARLAPPAKKGK